ncbi:cytochrome c biogenesis protein CcsA [Prevotella sp. E2-28]|uniref:cytochrome c biogenesis protein CcsA n=1 Tax=Prevotella sp. E2-28 TaxID=2913620 RepID=UPI001EDB2E72|nr:cytochrome c biogenesis protein CcsA [Prevotella sp. E2-28]UKK53676.1 cytochrome c biogenesis protein CcsA [Prevotella sp. E2-28]
MIKKTLVIIYLVVVAVMATATFVEHLNGFNIYAQWWFTALWGLLAAVAVVYFLSRHIRRLSVVVLHLSFLVILAGALLTRLTASQGFLHLRPNETAMRYVMNDGKIQPLPFSVKLDTFIVVYHPGTTAAMDYESHLRFKVDEREMCETVSMNHICSIKGFRLYQNSYDADGRGTVLTVNSDPWGIPVTYTGYALLFIGLIWMLIDPKGQYRQVLRSPLLRRGTLVLALLLGVGQIEAAPRTVPVETAEKMGQLNILYNDRICPLQTYAADFTKKLFGKPSYEGLTAEQVLAGYLFFADEWSSVPLKKQTDDRQWIIYELQHGYSLKVFPYTSQHGVTRWYAPVEEIDSMAVPAENRLLMTSYFDLLYGAVDAGNYAMANEYLDRLKDYQHSNGGASIPSDIRLKSERIYNTIPFATILFMVCLTMGFIAFFTFLFWPKKWAFRLQFAVLLLSFLTLTYCEALRWIISGNIPMSNGYETMLLIAWLIQLVTLFMQHRFRILLTFGFLLSGFFLLVSHISQMDPQIGHLMPVLRSPLLTLHVSIIMIAFALLSLTFICGLTGIAFHFTKRREQTDVLATLSRVFLYPALTTLGFGIFIGAIWANVSWGTYWSWDPKEVWALITFMVYAVVVHTQSFRAFQRPLTYHIYVTLCFLTILMTYFGVNYILGGMHSYA